LFSSGKLISSVETDAAPLPEAPFPQPVRTLADIARTSAAENSFVVFFFIFPLLIKILYYLLFPGEVLIV
jgi:hypothetical protein